MTLKYTHAHTHRGAPPSGHLPKAGPGEADGAHVVRAPVLRHHQRGDRGRDGVAGGQRHGKEEREEAELVVCVGTVFSYNSRQQFVLCFSACVSWFGLSSFHYEEKCPLQNIRSFNKEVLN